MVGVNGSSPHTWGIHSQAYHTPVTDRFIPTYVGHTTRAWGRTAHFTVHPHIRGAYNRSRSGTANSIGSSPHTWGIPGAGAEGQGAAGSSPHTWGIRGRPRRFPARPGSSPHTWGIHTPGGTPLEGTRFIPTYVGHTRLGQDTFWMPSGSSPHTWGIHWIAVRKMAGFSHFSYDFTRKSYFVQGLVFFGVIGAEAFPTHRRGRSQCLPGAHGGSVRNL